MFEVVYFMSVAQTLFAFKGLFITIIIIVMLPEKPQKDFTPRV